MANTSPDGIYFPLATDFAKPVNQLGLLATSVQNALNTVNAKANDSQARLSELGRTFFWSRSSGSQSIPNNLFTAIAVAGNAPQRNDAGFGYAGTTINLNLPGVYDVKVSGQFDASGGGGSRLLKVTTSSSITQRNGLNTAGSRWGSMSTSAFSIFGSETIIVDSPGTLQLTAYHDSGAALGITQASIAITRIG